MDNILLKLKTQLFAPHRVSGTKHVTPPLPKRWNSLSQLRLSSVIENTVENPFV